MKQSQCLRISQKLPNKTFFSVMTLRAKLTSFKSRILHFALPCLLGTIASAQVPQVSIVTSFTGIVLPPQVTVVPVRYKVSNGVERTMDVPLTCTDTLCTGNVVVVDSLRGMGSQSFTIARTMDSLAAFPLNALQERQGLAADRSHTLMVRNGKIWAFGWNHEGQLGLGYKDTLFHSQQRQIPGLNRIVSVAVGREFSVALDSAGDVWTWGSNFQGTLGNGSVDPSEVRPDVTYGIPKKYNNYFSNPVPQKVLTGKKVVSIAAGPIIVLAVDSSGRVWSWGYNLAGNIGRTPPPGKTLIPTLIPGLAGIRRVAASGSRSRWEYYQSLGVALGWNGSLWYMAYQGPVQIALNLSTYPNLIGPVSIQSGEAATLLEYVNTANGQHVDLAWGSSLRNNLTSPMASSTIPGYQGTGPLGMLSLGGEISIQVLSESSDPQGVPGQTFWRGQTNASGGATGWIPVQNQNGSTLISREVRAGTNHGVSLDSNGNLYCWGEGYACAGGSGFLGVLNILQDTAADLPLLIDGMIDTIIIPESISSMQFSGSLDGVAFSQSSSLTCFDSVCVGDIIVSKDAQHRFGREYHVKKVPFSFNQMQFLKNAIVATDVISGKITNRFRGDVFVSLIRQDQPSPVNYGTIALGKKSVDTLPFSFALADLTSGTVNGDFWGQVKIQGVGWIDSTMLKMNWDSLWFPSVRYLSESVDGTAWYKYLDSKLAMISAWSCPNSDYTGCGLHLPGKLVSLNDAFGVGSVNQSSKLIEFFPQTIWRILDAGSMFHISGADPISNISVVNDRHHVFGSELLSIAWNQSAVDSCRMIIQSNSGRVLLSTSLHTAAGAYSWQKEMHRTKNDQWGVVRFLVFSFGRKLEFLQAFRWGE